MWIVAKLNMTWRKTEGGGAHKDPLPASQWGVVEGVVPVPGGAPVVVPADAPSVSREY